VYKKQFYKMKKCVTDGSLWIISPRPTHAFVRRLPVSVRVRIRSFLGEITEGFLLTYVDDMLVTADRPLAAAVIKQITDRWKCTEPEVLSDCGTITFCSMKLTKKEGGNVLITQEDYISEMLDRRDLKGCNSNLIPMPSDECAEVQSTDLSQMTMKEKSRLPQVQEAQSYCGELNWIATRTRPDISYAVHRAASLTLKEPERSVKICKSVMRYLRGTADTGLVCLTAANLASRSEVFTDVSPLPETFDPHTIMCFTDASYGDSCYTGYVILVAGFPVLWKAARQTLASASTAESELIAALEGHMCHRGIAELVEEMMPTHWQVIMGIDNQAAISLLKEMAGAPWRTRFLRKKYEVLSQAAARGMLRIIHCPGTVQLADALTKVLQAVKLRIMMNLLFLEAASTCFQGGSARTLKVMKILGIQSPQMCHICDG